VSELTRNIPADAKKEFEKASKASHGGRTEEAIAHLRKAIALYPGFTIALSDLGSQLLGQGKLDEAAEVLSKAVSLDEKAFNPALNLGIVLVHQNRFSEAAQILTNALSLEPNSPAARLYSGIAAMALGKPEVAEKELKTAYDLGGSQYALALFHLGQLYMNRGNRNSALRSFEHYLSDNPNAVNADQVRKMIVMLQ
jgi:tetratricopeptide (TPR) repeat protein